MPKAKKTKQVGQTQPDNQTQPADQTQSDSKGTVKVSSGPEKTDYSDLIKQIQQEYQLAWYFMKPKLDEWAIRLKLYSNQKRDKTAVGDPLLFTIHSTVLAYLYDDRLMTEFMARNEGGIDQADNLTALAGFDYDEMHKDEIDYQWDWDASFFGRGLLLNFEWDSKRKCPAPEVIDPMTWLRDPRARSVNGDFKGRGAMRFGGREIRLSKADMDKMGIYFNYKDLQPQRTDIRSLVDMDIQARAQAQGFTDMSRFESLHGDNADFRILDWFTNWKGKRVFVSLADNRKRVVRFTELEHDCWPINERALYSISHDWDGVSIPDLVEDKQRARAVLMNLGLASIKLGVQPTYLYDTNRIKNRGNLEVDFNKHIPVEGNPTGAIQEVQRSQIKSEVNWIMDTLASAAEEATSTPTLEMGMLPSQRVTATTINAMTQKINTRYGLTVKVFGWSEQQFWKDWYQLYKDHFMAGIDEKEIRIVGAMGPKFRKLSHSDLITELDPDIKIESKTISDAKKLNDLNQYRLWMKDVLAVTPQGANTIIGLRREGRLSGQSKEEVEQVLPPSIDELKAEVENDQLSDNKLVSVEVADDDFMHMIVHNKATDTPAKTAHLAAHRKAMMLKRVNPAMDMANNRPPNPDQPPDQPGVGSMQPLGGAAPNGHPNALMPAAL